MNQKPSTKLERAVYSMLRSNANSTSATDVQETADDVMQHGCQSGIIGQLIYYTDTVKFYKKHRDEISKLVSELYDQTGEGPNILRGWDNSDPLAMEVYNQNVLAWFAFEEITRRLFDN